MTGLVFAGEDGSCDLSDWFFTVFGACGCGDPDAVAELLRDVLARISNGAWRDKLEDLLPTDGTMFSYLGWLNHLELLEHGTAMPGWLTDDGRAVLDALQRYGTDTDSWTV